MLNPEEANIFITHDLEHQLKRLVTEAYSQVIIIVDENTEAHCLPKVMGFFNAPQIIKIKSGEENKTLRTCEDIWSAMTDLKCDRKALVVNLGGGVIGDMGGFCAATYKRGLSFIQIPTTLLAQVDASVGGKLGVDFFKFKNHIGVFKVPDAVVICTDFLKTLPFEELRSGFAEIIKHCLIADKSKWEEIKAIRFQDQNWDDLAEHSIKIKAKIAKEDPTEKSVRKLLNFGHTIGHAIESFYLDKPGKKLLHGEAIAIGMIAEAWIAFKRACLSIEEVEDIKQYILSIYPKVLIPESDLQNIIPLTLQDKKNENSIIQCTLLSEIGVGSFNNPIDADDILASVKYYNQ